MAPMESVSVRCAVMEEGSRKRVQCAAVAFASLRGQLLIATPTLRDPNFQRTVVLVCDHSEEAAMGLVLNRPLELTVHDADGRARLTKTYRATRLDGSWLTASAGVFGSVDDLRVTLELALREVVDQALDDAALRAALQL